MIANPERTKLLSSIGWVDRDGLWMFKPADDRPEVIPLDTGARYASLHFTGGQRFAVGHHFDGARFDVSVRSFSSPSEVLASAVIEDKKSRLTGDPSVWMDVPRLYIEYLAFEPWKDFVLLKVSPSSGTIDVQRLQWYDDAYDKGYQGVVGVLALPGGMSALISVQRSSRLIVHDLNTGAKMNSIDLGDRGGNPRLEYFKSGKEIWASDYDTLVVLKAPDWQIDRRSLLQGSAAGTRQFIGDFCFPPDQQLCVVARPFSGDVIAVDSQSLKIKSSAKLGREPLEVAAIGRGEIVARDWKTGDLLRGTLHRRGFLR